MAAPLKPRPADHEDRVRWKQHGRWRYGHLNGVGAEPDGSVRVYDEYSGGARSLPTIALQRQVHGPRGGRHWEWTEPRPEPEPTRAPRPAWRPAEGPAELLNQESLWEAWP